MVEFSWLVDLPTSLQILLTDIIIASFCYLGWRAANTTRVKLLPILTMLERLPPERIARAGKFLERKFKEWEEMELEMERRGL